MNRAHAPAQALLLAACAWLPACGLNQAGVAPPADIFGYPASAVMDRNGDWLFVTNSNADLRYNDGTLMALSLTRAANDRASPPMGTTACPLVDYSNPRSDNRHFCCWNRLDNNILDCDERSYSGSDTESADPAVKNETLARGNVRIGSFAAGIVLQHVECPQLVGNPYYDPARDPTQSPQTDCEVCQSATSDNDRLLLGVRGDTSLTFIDVHSVGPNTPPTLNCVSDPTMAGDFATCDDDHRIIQAQTALASPMANANPPAVPLPDEPYALAIDYTAGLLYIGHLTGSTARPFSGGFSLFDIAPQGSGSNATLPPPRFIAPFIAPFPPNSLGALGVTTMSVHSDPQFGITESVLASSRFLPDVAGLGTTATCPDNPAREIAAFPNGISFSSPLAGGETRGIEYIEGQDRAFVLQRSPPTLIGFVPSTMAATDFLETCGSPTVLDKYPRQPRPTPPLTPPSPSMPSSYPKAPILDQPNTRLFVSCFADGEVYVYDPFVPQLVRTFSVGRGPAGLVFDDKRQVAYVVGFGDNNVSVIDLAPDSPTEYHVIQHIGFPRTAPR
jgi:hypothetical protein